MVHTLFDEDLVDLGHLAELVDGVDQVRALAREFAPEHVADHCGVPAEEIRAVARDLAAAPVAGNGARFVALVDGVWRDEALAFDRAFHFFGDDLVEAARAAWRGLAGRDGVERRYWRQGDDGRWEQAA